MHNAPARLRLGVRKKEHPLARPTRLPRRPLAALTLLALTLSGCSLPALPFARGSATPAPIAQRSPVATAVVPTAAAAPTPPTIGQDGSGRPPASAPPVVGPQPARLSGEMRFTSDYLFDSYVQNITMLADMHGFVIRDQQWPIPLGGQVLGPMTIERENGLATYQLQLPALPGGTFSDVDGDGTQDAGIQIFNVAWSATLSGNAFEEGDDQSFGWANGFTSTRHNPESEGEVSGGKLLVWAPDDAQGFPTAFGPDGLLFTADDPIGSLPAGYTVIDLDTAPFGLLRGVDQRLDLLEPQDIAAKDYTKLPYDQAFERLVADVRASYAFKGIGGKEPNWDELLATLGPRMVEAQQNADSRAFYRALRDFTAAFHDGHVSLSSGTAGFRVFDEEFGGGYGLVLRELDDGRFVVSYVQPDGPAAKLGIVVGAEVTSFNGKPLAEAAAAVAPPTGPFSTEERRRYEQVAYLSRAPVGTSVAISFQNPGAGTTSGTLVAVPEYDSLQVASVYQQEAPTELPVEARQLDSGVGYIKISTNSDDINLTLRLFERALATFEELDVPALIIDLRQNGGGFSLDLAGYFSKEAILTGQQERFNTKSGSFEPEGPREEIRPKERQFSFPKIAVMVGMACASACEAEAYGLSRLPGAVVVGQYPSAGIYASVIPEEYRLPEDLTLQVSKWRFTTPDGGLFLEGVGVQPTLRVPVTAESVLATDDVVLAAAEAAVLE